VFFICQHHVGPDKCSITVGKAMKFHFKMKQIFTTKTILQKRNFSLLIMRMYEDVIQHINNIMQHSNKIILE
jgi:hypothetical protein